MVALRHGILMVLCAYSFRGTRTGTGDGRHRSWIELCKKTIALILLIYVVLRTSEILLTFKFGIWFCERLRQPSIWNPPDFNLSVITTCGTTQTSSLNRNTAFIFSHSIERSPSFMIVKRMACPNKACRINWYSFSQQNVLNTISDYERSCGVRVLLLTYS